VAKISNQYCDNCGSYLCVEQIKKLPELIPELPIGQIVKICNKEHVWFDEIAIIKDKKHKHYRIELLGKLIWVPDDWVETHDIENSN
jgi:hypothetical protein